MIGVLLQAKAFCDVFCRLFRFTKDLEMSEKSCCGGCDPEGEVTRLEPGMVVTLVPGETLEQVGRPQPKQQKSHDDDSNKSGDSAT
jgi:hypothetical protein